MATILLNATAETKNIPLGFLFKVKYKMFVTLMDYLNAYKEHEVYNQLSFASNSLMAVDAKASLNEIVKC